MTSKHHTKRPFSSAIDARDSDVEIVDCFMPSTPLRARPRSSTSKRKSFSTGIDYGVIDIEDDADLNPTLASTPNTRSIDQLNPTLVSTPNTRSIDSHPDDLRLPATPLRKKRKRAPSPPLIISDSDDDEYLPVVQVSKAHTRSAPPATARANAASRAALATRTGRQAALPVTWEAWCHEHALKPNGEILQQQRGMYVMHCSDAITFFKFNKEELAPLPYYTFPNSNVYGPAATGSAYRWVDVLYHAFRKEVALKDGELGLKPPGDPTEQAMFERGKDLLKNKLERYNDRYKKQYPGKERFPPKIREVRPNSGGQLVSYNVKAIAARHRDLQVCVCTPTDICVDPKKRKKSRNPKKRQ